MGIYMQRNSCGTFMPEDDLQRYRRAIADMEREDNERKLAERRTTEPRSEQKDETAIAIAAMKRQIGSLTQEVRTAVRKDRVPRGLIQQSARFNNRPLPVREEKRRRTRMW